MEQRLSMSRKYLILALGIFVVVGGAIALLGTREASMGLWSGWATSGVAGAVTFWLLAWAEEREVREVLGAIVVGFLCRMALLALGLVVSLRLGAAPLWFCLGFFAVYLPGQVAEIGAAVFQTRNLAARGGPSARLEAQS